MKLKLALLLFFLISNLAISQTKELILSPDDWFVYLDSTEAETKTANYKYIRVIKDSRLRKEIYTVEEYYRSGFLRMSGFSKNSNGLTMIGNVTYYYENGTKKMEGKNIYIDKNGDAPQKIINFWDANGQQKLTEGNGFYDDKENGNYSKGIVKNGLKEGLWEEYSNKSKCLYKEIFENGKFISGELTDENNITSTYLKYETEPTPKNGIENFYKYIARNYKTPSVQGLTGKVFVSFVIDAEGKVIEPKVLRDLGYGTGEEAIRVLKNCENWNPGEQRGRKVRCTYSLPIEITSSL